MTLVAKLRTMGLEFRGFAREDMQLIKAHVLVTIGDRDAVRPEHAVEMFWLIPNAQLAVFPGADHFLLWQDPEKMLSTIAAFLDGPMPEQNNADGGIRMRPRPRQDSLDGPRHPIID
jgi:hypothetical protein